MDRRLGTRNAGAMAFCSWLPVVLAAELASLLPVHALGPESDGDGVRRSEGVPRRQH